MFYMKILAKTFPKPKHVESANRFNVWYKNPTAVGVCVWRRGEGGNKRIMTCQITDILFGHFFLLFSPLSRPFGLYIWQWTCWLHFCLLLLLLLLLFFFFFNKNGISGLPSSNYETLLIYSHAKLGEMVNFFALSGGLYARLVGCGKCVKLTVSWTGPSIHMWICLWSVLTIAWNKNLKSQFKILYCPLQS